MLEVEVVLNLVVEVAGLEGQSKPFRQRVYLLRSSRIGDQQQLSAFTHELFHQAGFGLRISVSRKDNQEAVGATQLILQLNQSVLLFNSGEVAEKFDIVSAIGYPRPQRNDFVGTERIPVSSVHYEQAPGRQVRGRFYGQDGGVGLRTHVLEDDLRRGRRAVASLVKIEIPDTENDSGENEEQGHRP